MTTPTPIEDVGLRAILAAAGKATPVEPQDLMAYEHGGGRLAILRDGKRDLIADFYGDGEDRDSCTLCRPQTITAIITELLSLRSTSPALDGVRRRPYVEDQRPDR